ncbi:unnamed protein product [Moneuplotes crassus]|uniref:Uncharacterized protein n=1 Tax=Euplotes crassus TaxID=5936 RepID=A0AAD1Y593_EUPCR|nr:unnamed protein product [Moneuplotes crassus]
MTLAIESYRALYNSIAIKKMGMRRSNTRRRNEIPLGVQNQMIQTIRKREIHNKIKALSPEVIRKIRPASPRFQIQFNSTVSTIHQETDSEKAQRRKKVNEGYQNFILKVRNKLSNFKRGRFLSPNMLRNKANLIVNCKLTHKTQQKGAARIGDPKKRYTDKLPILNNVTTSESKCFNL